MPRARKTQTNRPAQPLSEVPSQYYGAGVEMQQLERAMPAPAPAAPPTVAPGPTAQPGAAPTDGGEPPARDIGAVLAAAAQLRGQTGLMTGPTNRPTEPITAGLRQGPGAGPEALRGRTGTPAGDMLRMLSQQTGQPEFAMLADRAGA